MSPLLEAKNICKTYKQPIKVPVLQDINLTIHPKTSTSIIGASGSGKSTLLHILGTLETFSGDLYIHNQKVSNKNAAKLRLEHIGFVFQANNLLEELSLFDNILLKAKIARRSIHKNSPAYQAAEYFLEKVQLLDRKDFPVKYLSGGEKQRGSIARALMNEPSLIFADEPTGNLDQTCAKEVQETLLSCCSQENTALVVVTHDPQFAKLCDEKYILQNKNLTRPTVCV